jgi:ABC-type multidrug transport system fused ATPase/permease subunit
LSTVAILLYIALMEASVAAGQEIGLWTGLKAIYARMSQSRRRQLFIVLVLMFFGAIAELATIGAVIPFIALLAKTPGQAHGSFLTAILPARHAVPIAATLFVFFAVLAGIVRLILARETRRFTFRLGHELAVEIQRRVLFQPLTFHIHRNSSTLLTALNKTEILVYDVLLPFMYAVIGGTMAICIIVLLLFVAPLTAIAVAIAFALTYGLVSALLRKRLAANSKVMETAFDARLQVVQESLGGIRDVIIDNSQSTYLNEFRSIDSRLADARATNQVVALAPRYAIEMVGMIVIAGIALIAADRPGGLAAALPVLGALALGAQRLLPLVQEVYTGWSTLEGQRSTFRQIIELLALPVEEPGDELVAPLEFRRDITLEKVHFSYATRDRPALEGVSLTVPRGAMLALIGPTGSGKSTLLDVLMGLLEPDQGRIFIDDMPLERAARRRWHRTIAHVPQSIFLADSTIARNIALGLPDIPPDREQIMEAAKKAQLHDFVLSLPAGYETTVGERGVRLSGGQRQRLGLARAIYKGAPVMILDEATSALDDETEAAVIASLEALRREGRTIVIVAHRASTIRNCDLVARLDRGRLVEIGRFEEIVSPGESRPAG